MCSTAPGAQAEVRDSERPTLTLSGSLYDNRGTTLAEGVYELDIAAEGGVRSIEVRVDGDWDESWEQECADPSCSMERTYTFDTFDWPGIEWTITVVATDFHGNSTTSEEIRVTPPGDPGDPGIEVPEGTIETPDETDDPAPEGQGCGPTSTSTELGQRDPLPPAPSTEPVSFICVRTVPGAVPDEGVESDQPTEDGDWTAGEPADDEESFEDEESVDGSESVSDDEADDAAADGASEEGEAAAPDGAEDPGASAPYGDGDAAPAASMR